MALSTTQKESHELHVFISADTSFKVGLIECAEWFKTAIIRHMLLFDLRAKVVFPNGGTTSK